VVVVEEEQEEQEEEEQEEEAAEAVKEVAVMAVVTEKEKVVAIAAAEMVDKMAEVEVATRMEISVVLVVVKSRRVAAVMHVGAGSSRTLYCPSLLQTPASHCAAP
jgi:hypothetical protein